MNLTKDCPLVVSQTSRDEFYQRVENDDATSLMLILNFSKSVNVIGQPDVILPLKWRWVFSDTKQYLKMPYPAIVWSQGLLALHNGHSVTVDLTLAREASPLCRNISMVIGENIIDMMIGNALGSMTDVIADNNRRHNTSHWCYMKKLPDLHKKL